MVLFFFHPFLPCRYLSIISQLNGYEKIKGIPLAQTTYIEISHTADNLPMYKSYLTCMMLVTLGYFESNSPDFEHIRDIIMHNNLIVSHSVGST